MTPEPDDADLIIEEPMENREIDAALQPHLSRTERRRFIRALVSAGLIVFREYP